MAFFTRFLGGALGAFPFGETFFPRGISSSSDADDSSATTLLFLAVREFLDPELVPFVRGFLPTAVARIAPEFDLACFAGDEARGVSSSLEEEDTGAFLRFTGRRAGVTGSDLTRDD